MDKDRGVTTTMDQALLTSVNELNTRIAINIDKLKKVQNELESSAEEDLEKQIHEYFREQIVQHKKEAKEQLGRLLSEERKNIQSGIQHLEDQKRRLREYESALKREKRMSLNNIMGRTRFVRTMEADASAIFMTCNIRPRVNFKQHTVERCKSVVSVTFDSAEEDLIEKSDPYSILEQGTYSSSPRRYEFASPRRSDVSLSQAMPVESPRKYDYSAGLNSYRSMEGYPVIPGNKSLVRSVNK